MTSKHIDSFNNNPDATPWPTKVGKYWFHGYRYGKYTLGKENEKELSFCDVFDTSGGLFVVIDGQYVHKDEIEESVFIPATLPELPN
jgi:hypothetical protein